MTSPGTPRQPHSAARHTPPPFEVLVVCTGNLARSPMGQRLLQTYLADAPDIVVSSAGTWGLEGRPMAEHAATALAEVGIDTGGFRARALSAPIVAGADLVLTATREHRAAVLAEHPAALRRTFTLREMARLLDAAAPVLDQPGGSRERASAVVAAAAQARGSVRAPAGSDDIADPYGRSLDTFRACREQIAGALHIVAAAVTGTPTVDAAESGGHTT